MKIGDAHVFENQWGDAWIAQLGDVRVKSIDAEFALPLLESRLALLSCTLPEPEPIPLPGWFKRLGLPTGPRVRHA